MMDIALIVTQFIVSLMCAVLTFVYVAEMHKSVERTTTVIILTLMNIGLLATAICSLIELF